MKGQQMQIVDAPFPTAAIQASLRICSPDTSTCSPQVESSWNVMEHGDAREGKLRGNWRMEWVASTLHTTSELGVSSITTITSADEETLAASSRLNWSPSPI